MDLYAGNLLLYCIIHDQRDFIPLQLDIDKVADWVDANCLTMNATKCKVLVISRRIVRSAPEVCQVADLGEGGGGGGGWHPL